MIRIPKKQPVCGLPFSTCPIPHAYLAVQNQAASSDPAKAAWKLLGAEARDVWGLESCSPRVA